MLKNLTRTLALAASLFASTSQALPIVEADAFISGDNKAALETSTGLVWMDFGVNSHLSYTQVVDALSSQFTGWRLPTAAEVDHLWSALFGSLPEWNRFSQGFGTLSSMAQDDYFESVFEVFGNSADSLSENRDQDGNVIDSWTNKSMFAVFVKEPGVSGFVSADSPYDTIHFSTAMYLEMNGADVSSWFGTLLVKDSPTSVPEPSTLLLCLLGMLGVVARRRILR